MTDAPPTPAPRSMAALATVPGREAGLEVCLRSLRPQVEQLLVVCHDMPEPPACVRELADDWDCEPDTAGSAAPLRWSAIHQGLYLKCDDDWHYPVNYVATMLRWVKRWKGRALVTCHGRVLSPQSRTFPDVIRKAAPQSENDGGWLNYPGGCALAFDTRLAVPPEVPGKNLEEAYLAVWAQYHRVPIWLVPHAAGWLEYLAPAEGLPTIWAEEKAAAFANRNAVLAPVVAEGGRWTVRQC